jgi:hypothetical protein
MGFSLITGQNAAALKQSTATGSVTLAAAPTKGNLVCVAIAAFNGATAMTLNSVSDGNSNSYTVTPNSPSSSNVLSAGSLWLAYFLSASSSASATINANFSSSILDITTFAMEFAVAGGTQTFDQDVVGSGLAGTSVNTPSITPTNANSLLFAAVASASGATAAGTPWTIGQAQSNNADEYDLSASSLTGVNFTQISGSWDSMAMAFFVALPTIQQIFAANAVQGQGFPPLIHFNTGAF